ncbi:acetolactate synthase, regulatory subunit [Rhizina undulata]
MTIVFSGTGLDGVVEHARRRLEDLVPVWAVLDYTESPLVQRELLLTKIAGDEFRPSKLPISQELRHKNQHLQSITQLTHQFGGNLFDISKNNCIFKLSAKPSRIDVFMRLISPF